MYQSLAAFGFIDALDVDLRGRIVGAVHRPGLQEPAWAVLDRGRVIGVNSSTGLEHNYVGRLSSAGVMVGGGFNRPYNDSLIVHKAVVWSSINSSPIILFPGELDDSLFLDVNDRGVAVGAASVTGERGIEQRAFMWTRQHGTRELDQLLSRRMRRNHRVSFPVAINNEGEIIASVARRNRFGGFDQPVLAILYPVDSSYPCALR